MEPSFKCVKNEKGYRCNISTEKSRINISYRNGKVISLSLKEDGKKIYIDSEKGLNISSSSNGSGVSLFGNNIRSGRNINISAGNLSGLNQSNIVIGGKIRGDISNSEIDIGDDLF